MKTKVLVIATAALAAGILLAGIMNSDLGIVDPGTGDPETDPGKGPTADEMAPAAIVSGLTHPWSIDWLPDGTMLFTERGGTLYSWNEEKTELLSLDVRGGEGGLLGIAVDPAFEENKYVYLYYTYGENFETANRVVRHAITELELGKEEILVDGIPGSSIHDGGRIAFGPDGMLYIATGDAADEKLAQDLDSLAGKILRMSPDGTIPDDNPFPGSYVYSYGHRNPQGMDWDGSGNMIITEHGPSGFESGRDEINHILPGRNYGWPDSAGDVVMEGTAAPLYHTGSDTWAPSGAVFYQGDKIPEWNERYVVAGLRGQSLYVLNIDLENGTVIPDRWYEGKYGRLRDVAAGPDGHLYVLTSNGNDDKILRIPGK